MVKVYINGQMAEFIMEIGLMEKCMEKDYSHGQKKESIMKANIKMTKKMVMIRKKVETKMNLRVS
jgi:hypothetical protein